MATDSTFLILASEAVAVLLVIIGIALVWAFGQGKLDKTAIADLIHRIKKGETERSESLHSTFSNDYRYQGDELLEAVGEVLEKEREVYRALISIYRNRDRGQITQFTEKVEALVGVSLGMVPNTNDEAYEKTIADLREEQKRLMLDLEATKQSFADLMNEYTRAFDKEKQTAEALAKSTPVPPSLSVKEPDIEVDTQDVAGAPNQEQMLETLAQLDAALDIGTENMPEIAQPEMEAAPPLAGIDWDALLADDEPDPIKETRATGT